MGVEEEEWRARYWHEEPEPGKVSAPFSFHRLITDDFSCVTNFAKTDCQYLIFR